MEIPTTTITVNTEFLSKRKSELINKISTRLFDKLKPRNIEVTDNKKLLIQKDVQNFLADKPKITTEVCNVRDKTFCRICQNWSKE